jgi:hypothetical protein
VLRSGREPADPPEIEVRHINRASLICSRWTQGIARLTSGVSKTTRYPISRAHTISTPVGSHPNLTGISEPRPRRCGPGRLAGSAAYPGWVRCARGGQSGCESGEQDVEATFEFGRAVIGGQRRGEAA